MLVLLLITACSALVYYIIHYYHNVARYPKGPTPLPFIGNLLDIDFKAMPRTFAKMSKTYGGMYTVFMPAPFLQINDFKLIREAFIEKGDDFVGRPTNKIVQEAICFSPNTGVINSNGENWREQRRVAISIMRDFGMGKNLMEEKVRSSIEDYIAHLKSIEDLDNVDMRWPIQVMVANIINETLFGYRYSHEDCAPLMKYVDDFNLLLEQLADSKGMMLGIGFPFLTKLPVIGWYTFGQFKDAMTTINKYVVDNVDRTLEEYSTDSEPTCFVQAYKQKMDNSGNSFLDMMNLYSSCADFFLAGQETTTTTLRWAMIIMAKHQEIQERLRDEIHEVVGKDQLPAMADQVKMPYTRACVLELQRFANILQSYTQRVAVRDTQINGQFIPEGTWVNADIHFLMENDPLFVNPTEFQPERYLTEDGKSSRKDLVEHTIPFSIGKRACAGEGLARVELFLCLTSTFQNFKITPREGQIVDLQPKEGQIYLPKPQKLRLEIL